MTLHKYEGAEVLRATVKITKAGDGLSEALGIEPAEYRVGAEVYVVLKTVVKGVAYAPIANTDALTRVHTLEAQEGTIVGAALVSEVLAEQAARIQRARDEAAGTPQLPIGPHTPEGGDHDA